MKKLSIIIIFILFSSSGYTHQNFYITSYYGNVKVRILTGFQYEEIQRAQIIGALAEILAKELQYDKPIFMDFIHDYNNSERETYFLSFDRGVFAYNHEGAEKEKPALKRKGIVVRQIDNEFDIVNTLKILEYAIINLKNIKNEQQQIQYIGKYRKLTLNTIDATIIQTILNTKVSKTLQKIKTNKIYRWERNSEYRFTYYWQNDQYHIIYKEEEKETDIITIDNIYQIQSINGNAFLFDTKTTFWFLNGYKKNITSRKWPIKNTGKNYQPYDIRNVGGDLFSIYLSYYSGELETLQPKQRTLLYAADTDTLIQDLKATLKIKTKD